MVDADGFEEFVRAHGTELLRSASLLAMGRDRGEELLQDTLTHLYPRWARVMNADAPMAYVRRTMANRLISASRSPSRRETVVAWLPDRSSEHDPVRNLIDRHALFHMLSQVSERQRAAVVLRYFDDLSDAQIAEIIGCRPATVRSLISRALADMRHGNINELQDKAGA